MSARAPQLLDTDLPGRHFDLATHTTFQLEPASHAALEKAPNP